MNERQQAHADYFIERLEHYKGIKGDRPYIRMLAARDADARFPLRTEEEAAAVVAYLDRLEKAEEG